MKKEMKKQLKADEFAAIINKIIRFVQERMKELVIGAAVLLFLFLIFLGVKYIQTQQLKKESIILGQINQLYIELQENPDKLVDLEKLGGKGRFSRMAFIHVATYSFEKGDSDKALASLDKIPTGRKDLIYYQGQKLKAEILTHQKKYDEAIAILQKIEDENPKNYILEAILFSRAMILVEKGDTDQALALFKKIQEDFPQTYYSYEASREATELEIKK